MLLCYKVSLWPYNHACHQHDMQGHASVGPREGKCVPMVNSSYLWGGESEGENRLFTFIQLFKSSELVDFFSFSIFFLIIFKRRY